MPSLCAPKELLQTEIRENTSIHVPVLFIYSRAWVWGDRDCKHSVLAFDY